MGHLFLTGILLLCSILCLSFANFFVNQRLKKHLGSADAVLSINLLKSTFFICCGLLISEAGTVGKEVLNFQSLSSMGELTLLLTGYLSLFFCMALLIAFICIWFSRLIFSAFTKGKNIFEVAANNDFGNMTLFSGIAICITVVVKPGLSDLLIQAIRYSSTPIFH